MEHDVAEKSGADILVETLLDLGVDTVFGYPGGAVLPIYDALYEHPKIKHILVRHEQAATHAAEGYARSTGKPGVVLVTSGPGATNAVTGIADAYMDSIPLVVITGQVPTALIGTDAFQEADTVGLTRHCTKHNYLVKDPERLGATIEEAFRIATTGRPGPVVVDIPKDVQIALATQSGQDGTPLPSHRYQPRMVGAADEIAEAKGHEKLSGFAEALEKANGELQKATMWFMQHGMANPNNAGAGAYHYMHIMGIVSLGLMWLRMSKAAQATLDAGTDNAKYYEAKLVTAQYFAERFLPDTGSLRRKIEGGADSIMALDPEMFGVA